MRLRRPLLVLRWKDCGKKTTREGFCDCELCDSYCVCVVVIGDDCQTSSNGAQILVYPSAASHTGFLALNATYAMQATLKVQVVATYGLETRKRQYNIIIIISMYIS